MNAFEDFIDELKEENLLEETVIESREADDEYAGEMAVGLTLLKDEESYSKGKASKAEPPDSSESNLQETLSEDVLIVGNAEIFGDVLTVENFPALESEEKKTKLDEKEFYRKRAMDEVSGLQMVEHVFSGVEREQMKSVPENYNDISAKKALHDFLQNDADVKSPEHAQAEFQMMHETETWCSALSHRDKRISVEHLRRYCEMTRPPLSSQALISLARFYRNLPFSESVRGKFDFVVTKLFSKDDGHDKRVLVFSREELIRHFKELYAEWSSISLYSADDDDSNIVLAALKFEDFMAECEAATHFDELVKTDFFNRLRLFKESTNEVFFAPLVTVAAIECNTRIGNRYVDLIQAERTKNNGADLKDKHGFLHDQAISDATSKTFQLIELLKEKAAIPKSAKLEEPKKTAGKHAKETFSEKAESAAARTSVSAPKKETKIEYSRAAVKNEEKSSGGLLTINKWLLAVIIFVVASSAAFYFYVDRAGNADASTNGKKVNLQNSSLKEFLESARISGETFHGVTLPAWEILTNEKKEETLKKIFSIGTDKGYSKVHLINKDGKSVGSASAEKIEVVAP